MNEALWYFTGLLTLPAVLLLVLLWGWLTDKNYRLDCLRCDRAFGEIGEDYKRIQVLKFWLHRYNGECSRNAKQ